MLFITILGNLLLFALVFGMSATVDIRALQTQIRNYKALAAGIGCQFLVMPLLGFLVVRTMNMTPQFGITLLVVTSSPGGSYSNWWCSMFNADLALSVTMTAVSTILSTIMLPLNLLFYTRFSYQADIVQNIDWTSLFIAIGIVTSAISMGLLSSAFSKSRKFNKIANHIGNASGLSLMIFSATMTNAGSETKIWNYEWKFYVGVMLPCLGGMVVANIVAAALSLARAEQVTVAIECCYQSVGIATSLALTMFNGAALNEAMGVPFVYGICEMVLVGTYCVSAWKLGYTKAPSDAPLWMVLFTSYEIREMEQKDIDEIEININDSEHPISEQQHGNSLTTYFNLAWWSPDEFTQRNSDGILV